jgi:hypothetical protein
VFLCTLVCFFTGGEVNRASFIHAVSRDFQRVRDTGFEPPPASHASDVGAQFLRARATRSVAGAV